MIAAPDRDAKGGTMAELELFIGNKNYSSWSFRPWIALKAKGIAFSETLRPFHEGRFQAFSPSSKVPVLRDGEITVWESLAILEYLAEGFPEKGFWPEDKAARAEARAIANEMHGGFWGLRSECPMNMRREVRAIAVSQSVRRDVARIEAIWQGCLEASGGPFLFGEFSNADAMFAPVVNRLKIYDLSANAAVLRYGAAMTALPAWREWEAASRAEPWIVEEDEV